MNEGEIPQYYVRDNHEAIIPPETFEMVQTLMATRKKGKNRLSSVSIFSSKIKCADCGSWYGPKVWHSNDAYRKVIRQCNHKFEGQKCGTPTLTEDRIKELTIKNIDSKKLSLSSSRKNLGYFALKKIYDEIGFKEFLKIKQKKFKAGI